MLDPLHARANLAIEESRKLRAEKLLLDRDYLEHLKALQYAILESAMVRMEMNAHRDNQEGGERLGTLDS